MIRNLLMGKAKRNSLYHLCIVSLILLLVCCHSKSSFRSSNSLMVKYPMLFNDSQPILSDTNVKCSVQLRSSRTGDTLLFAIDIMNRSADTLKINPGELQIATPDNSRSDLAWFDPAKLVVFPNSIQTMLFKFSPVNNLAIFNETNYKGDLDSVYYIKMNFIHQGNKQVFGELLKFSVNKVSYKKYRQNYALNNTIKIFELKNKGELEQAVALSAKASDLNARKPNKNAAVFISNGDLTIYHVLISLKVFTVNARLFLKAKIVNSAKYELKLNPSQFIIKTANGSFDPGIVSVSNTFSVKDPTNNYHIVTGGRLELTLNYTGFHDHYFSLSNKGIAFMDTTKKLIPRPLNFGD